MMFEEGRRFANFKIIRKLGEGGMGEVYLAEDLKLGRNVALKILQSEFFDDPDRLARFTREAKTAAKISHASVMAIYDLDRATDESSGRDISYIVMENVTGQTLGEYLKTRTPANSFVGWNPCPEGVVLSGVEGRGSDNMSRTQGSRHGTLVSNLRVGTRKGVPTYGTG